MDAAYKPCLVNEWDRDNSALRAPWLRLGLVPDTKNNLQKVAAPVIQNCMEEFLEIKAHFELKLNGTPCAVETWSEHLSYLN